MPLGAELWALGLPALVFAGAFVAFLLDRTPWRLSPGWVTVAGLMGCMALARQISWEPTQAFSGPLLSLLFLAGAATALVALAWARSTEEPGGELFLLINLTVCGMSLMIAAQDTITLFIGLELTSLPLYGLCAYRRNDPSNVEAGVKFFVLGSMGAALLLFGSVWVYGATGTFDLAALAKPPETVSMSFAWRLGVLLFMAGLAFKLALVPFHQWLPDVFQGAPTPITGLLATGAKIAGIAPLLKIGLAMSGAPRPVWTAMLVALAGASLIVGNLTALSQTHLKRLLAYSSISHVGFMALGLIAGNTQGFRGTVYYLAAYTFMNIGAFALATIMQRRDQSDIAIADLAGLGQRSPGLALALGVILLSLAGLPATAGFMAKLFVFLPLMESGYTPVLALAVFMAIVAFYYYLRVILTMCLDEPAAVEAIVVADEMRPALAVVALMVALVIVAGIWPSQVVPLNQPGIKHAPTMVSRLAPVGECIPATEVVGYQSQSLLKETEKHQVFPSLYRRTGLQSDLQAQSTDCQWLSLRTAVCNKHFLSTNGRPNS